MPVLTEKYQDDGDGMVELDDDDYVYMWKMFVAELAITKEGLHLVTLNNEGGRGGGRGGGDTNENTRRRGLLRTSSQMVVEDEADEGVEGVEGVVGVVGVDEEVDEEVDLNDGDDGDGGDAAIDTPPTARSSQQGTRRSVPLHQRPISLDGQLPSTVRSPFIFVILLFLCGQR
jgi:hypothetical protein